MMNLNTMRAVVDTLDENGTSPIADELLAAWGVRAGSAHYFRASANFVFQFLHADQRRALRFTHASERTLAMIEAEMSYLNQLAAKNVPIAQPIHSLSGQYVESIPTMLGVFHAVVFEGLSGTQFDLEDLTLDQVTVWGTALGQLHTATQGYQTAGRPTWRDHVAVVADHLPPEEQTARHVLIQVQHQVEQIPVNEQTFGLIHYDFELDNLIWKGQQISIVDFDDCARYWFVADVAYALRDVFDDRADQVDLNHDIVRAFIRGYRLARDLTDNELALISLFLKLHNLVTFTKLLRTLDRDDQRDDPTWVRELRKKLSMKVQTYRDAFTNYAV